jgi:y4mF family transcriptional regulator
MGKALMFPLGKIQGMMAISRSFVPERDQPEAWSAASMDRAIRSVGELGVALRAERKALGLTQADLALAAGVGLRFVVELEAGKPTLQLLRVLRVIDALGGTLELGGLAGTGDQRNHSHDE